MALATIKNLQVGYGGPLLVDDVSFVIEEGEKIGLLGRNGAGKTSLMRVFAGELLPENGEIQFKPGATIARLQQEVPSGMTGVIHSIVADGWKPHAHEIDQPWRRDPAVEKVLSLIGLNPVDRFETLSSGMKRRVLLARTLVNEPDLLLLDEPTNHLDVPSIEWLETFLAGFGGSLIFVTHDRAFLKKLANRIIEIERGRIFDWASDYETFLKRKEQALAAEEQEEKRFDKRLAEEEAWIRTGIKARRTRNEGRVRALEEMRKQRAARRSKTGQAKMDIQEASRSGALVVDAETISFSYADRAIFKDFSTSIMRGDRVGILGPNGAGKSTLLKVLLGQLSPTAGKIRLGTNLQIAYFDQLRDQLDEEKTIVENVGEGSDRIRIGDRLKHIHGYLQDFLFSPERARTPVRSLSGGERNRVLLAKLFSKPANIVILDEPTNDLDAETLELLEDRLAQFQGTVLLVSHDRAFLDNVVSSVIVFEEDGLNEYFGGYSDWKWVRDQRVQSEAALLQSGESSRKSDRDVASSTEKQTGSERKLRFEEQKELKKLPERIEKLEQKIRTLHDEMAEPSFYECSEVEMDASYADLEKTQAELATAYERWEELEGAM